MIRKTYKKNDILWREGQMGDWACYLLKGSVRQISPSRTEKPIIVEKGDMVGTVSALNGEPRPFTVIAKEETEVVTFTRSTMLTAIETAHPFIPLFIYNLLMRYRFFSKKKTTELDHIADDHISLIEGRLSRKGNMLVEELEKADAFREAVQKKELKPHFCPIVSLKKNNFQGFESSIHFHCPGIGPLDLEEFTKLAEKNHLMSQVYQIILEGSYQQLQNIQKSFLKEKTHSIPTSFFINANFLSHHLLDESTIKTVKTFFKETSFPPSLLKIEITESELIHDSEIAAQILKRLKSLGISICLDEFGTAHSSLGYLYDFPIDMIKISPSFIRNLPRSERCQAIVRTIMTLAESMQISVLANGIEDAQTAAMLQDMGCTYGQGPFFQQHFSWLDNPSKPEDWTKKEQFFNKT